MSLTFKTVGYMSWQDSGLCAQSDPELFFEEVQGSDNPEARAVCRNCPVMVQCLQFALDNEEEFGIWGGLTPRGRNRFRKKYKRVTSENLNDFHTRYERNKRDRMKNRRQW